MVLPITFLSDYGHEDEFVGICHGVIARIAAGARVIDLGHGVSRGDIRQGAVRLADALPYTPAGIHLTVVDPGVGGTRRAVAIKVADRFLVGPDNGLLGPATKIFGGADEAVDIGHSPVRLEPTSATFHGRDIFAPVAAHLANGASLESLGQTIPVASLLDLNLPSARVTSSSEGKVIEVEVLAIDTFGNASLSATADDLYVLAANTNDPLALAEGEAAAGGGQPDAVTIVLAGQPRRIPIRPTFGAVQPGDPVLLTDSSGRLALAVNQSSAAEHFSLTPGTSLRLT